MLQKLILPDFEAWSPTAAEQKAIKPFLGRMSGTQRRNPSRASRAALQTSSDSIASLPPIRLTSGEKKAHAFAHKRWQLLSNDFRLISHQGTHQHWKQNKVHKNLCRGDTSFRTEGSPADRESAWVVSFKTCETAAAVRSRPASWTCRLNAGNLFGFGNRRTSYADCVLDKSFHEFGAEICELVLHTCVPSARSPRNWPIR